MSKILKLFTSACIITQAAIAQTDAGLLRYPDVSKTQIVFTYANDIWIVPKGGGTAIKLSSPPGIEAYPRFSPDGSKIAFSGNYDGNVDAYVMPTTGGVPVRLTEHGYPDRVVDWTPDGRHIYFASLRESGKARFNQFYTIADTGGAASKMPFAYAEFGSYSPDGKQMALVFRSQSTRNWKRYRGGWRADIHIYNFADTTSENISLNSDAGYEFPMWSGNYIYFISDRGPELRMNLWRYNTTDKAFEQLTHFTDYDIHFPSLGPDEIVFENGGKLYLYPLAGGTPGEVKVNVVADEASIKPKTENVKKYFTYAGISPDGNRVVVEARGDLFSLPAAEGFVKNLTQSSGTAERYPAWSPDGKTIAYWSDKSGEYELYLMQPGKEGSEKKITGFGPGFRYALWWSPDSKKVAFIDKAMQIKVVDVTTGTTTNVDKGLRMSHGNLDNFTVSWSPDSRYLTYSRDLENYHTAIYIYDYNEKQLHQATSGFYTAANPVFDIEGKYLYVLTNQAFQAYYSDIDNSFVYANSTKLAAIPLNKKTTSLLYPKNDTVAVKSDSDNEVKATAAKGKESKDKSDTKSDETSAKNITIDFDGFEQRMELLPLSGGNYSGLSSAKGKLLYVKYPFTGAGEEAVPSLNYYDIEDRKEKKIADGVGRYIMAANGEKVLVQSRGNVAVLKIAENQKMDKLLRMNEMEMTVNPKEEWQQIFNDAWRIERDYFYDSNMHGVNWNEMKARYGKMLQSAMTRDEVNFVLGEMLGELNASHTYKGGGDIEDSKELSVGYLGIDWQADGQYYKIKKILKGAPWDAEVHSALEAPGIDIKEGMYILAVNGKPLTTAEEPYAAFQGLGDKTVELTYNNTPSFTGAKTAVVKTMDDEYRLRYLNWVENSRKKVEQETNGEAGYIYVPSTGVDGQTELLRQFNAQWDKKALIIDERFNDGGQIPDRFIEVLDRTPLAYWAIRDGEAWPWPPYANFGPKVMLINGWSGSGGDAFPDYFRKKGLGPLIGNRTWGGLIGISGTPDLIDGGSITAPSFRMYNPNGTWFKEGHGVDPDIMVDEDLAAMAKGIDPQLEKGIAEIKNLIKTKGYTAPKQPAPEKR
ncbi:peptidase S41 [Ilyomonas limi]|uniref:Tricorn protease homolog n=1 Tax=Ilyomonas limi TaxID=2575867 RepID=A0A4U3L1E5_9BACT|nr:S41 family peptidase [Ilyomonas limi]TKK67267.1 peptidase S41 [Ilyomonas limi]